MLMIDTNIKKVKRLFCLFALFYLCPPSIHQVFGALSYTIRKIQVEGNVGIEADLLIALSGLGKGSIIDPTSRQTRACIQKIAKHEGIRSVAMYLSDIDDSSCAANLVISVQEHPQLGAYLIEGISKKEQKELLENITINTHTPISPLFLQKTTKSIKKFFLEKGFRNVQVFINYFPQKNIEQLFTLKIRVNKGQKSIVNNIIFEGNDHLDTDLLLYSMEALQGAPRFTLVQDIFKQFIRLPSKRGVLLELPLKIDDIKRYLFKHVSFFPSVFTEEKYIKAKESLIRLYQAKGFRDVNITEEHFKTYSDGRLNIHLKIEEGKQYVVRSLKWVGNRVYNDQVLEMLLNLDSQKIYDPIYIKSRLSYGGTDPTIADLYNNNGYLFFHAEVVETSIKNNQVDLEIRIQEGKQATINRVDIIGNTLTHDYVIRRELLTLPGEKYNLGLVRESLNKLMMLELFKPDKLIPNLQPDISKGTVDLIYSVEEQPKFDFKLDGSWSNGITGGLTIGSNNVSLKNLFTGKIPIGAGQGLHFSGELRGKDYKKFSFSFQEPWLWLQESRYIFSLSFNSAYQTLSSVETNALNDWLFVNMFPLLSQERKENIRSTGGQIKLGKKLTKHWEGHLDISYHYHAYRHIQLLEDHRKRLGYLHDFSLGLLFVYNTINHPDYPTRGCLWSNYLTVTPPYTLFGASGSQPNEVPPFKELGKLMIDGCFFQKLPANFVFHIRAHSGFLNSLSNKAIGPFDRFYLGGTSITPSRLLGGDSIALRGYPDDSLTPQDYKRKMKGGVLFGKFVSELRYPVIISPVCWYLLGFLEIGDTWLNYTDFNLSNIKKSIGGGMRLKLPLPMIPMLGLDVGYRLDAIKSIQSWENDLEYHFTVGSTFR